MNEIPIACSLSAAEQGERRETTRRLVAAALLGARVTERGASLRFAGASAPALRELIAAESECCPFLRFDLRERGEELLLDVEGPEGARPIVLELFGLDDSTGA
jgi:MerR family copper efflux transcriptional regulator